MFILSQSEWGVTSRYDPVRLSFQAFYCGDLTVRWAGCNIPYNSLNVYVERDKRFVASPYAVPRYGEATKRLSINNTRKAMATIQIE